MRMLKGKKTFFRAKDHGVELSSRNLPQDVQEGGSRKCRHGGELQEGTCSWIRGRARKKIVPR